MLLLLSTIKRTASSSILIKGLLDSGEIFDPMRWPAKVAGKFLEETPLYNRAGVLCRIPDWWRTRSQGVKLNFTVGDKKSSLFGINSLVDFDMQMSVGGEPLTEDEVKALLKESEGLTFLKGKWVKVDKENLSDALTRWQAAKRLMKENHISFHEAMKILGGQAGSLDINPDEVEVTQGEWLASLLDKLKNPQLERDLKPARTFKGSLRHYQQHGFNWLNTLHSLGLGGCLADDMGLGKTIQILVFLQKIAQKEKGPHLLVVPTSLLSNWEDEMTF